MLLVALFLKADTCGSKCSLCQERLKKVLVLKKKWYMDSNLLGFLFLLAHSKHKSPEFFLLCLEFNRKKGFSSM